MCSNCTLALVTVSVHCTHNVTISHEIISWTCTCALNPFWRLVIKWLAYYHIGSRGCLWVLRHRLSTLVCPISFQLEALLNGLYILTFAPKQTDWMIKLRHLKYLHYSKERCQCHGSNWLKNKRTLRRKKETDRQNGAVTIHDPQGVSCLKAMPRRSPVTIYERFKATVAVRNARTR